jgi:flagellar L-ring protein precursor FlgH
MNKIEKCRNLMLVLLLGSSLTACGAADRIASIGKAPEMSRIANPQLQPGYQPVTMPMPSPKSAFRQPNSLWQADRQAFFKDQRAGEIGDILTVLIDISDEAELENESERTRSGEEESGLERLLGYESALHSILPEAIAGADGGTGPESLSAFESSSKSKGTGTIEREEEIELTLAAIITQILPNGNFVIHGRQEVRVNFEKRIIEVDGVIRPEDISTDNTVSYDKIAEARISYGGEGHISDMQQPRYGQQLYDIVFPF